MQNINSIIMNSYKFCLITDNADLIAQTDLDNVYVIQTLDQLKSLTPFRVISVDYNFILNHQAFDLIKNKFQRLIFIFNSPSEKITPYLFKQSLPDQIVFASNYSNQIFFEQDLVLTETQQNLTYLNLAADLNQEYENIKLELENKLDETKLDLLASRQKILDSNIRIEAMRKILYSVTQESDLHRIETVLNELLPASSKATWIKIIPVQHKQVLEVELNHQLNTTFKSYALPNHAIYFIKGDQKNFKKDDLNLFAKIRDIIEINYNREVDYTNLVLTQNIVRKAFAEFNHPLAVMDSDYCIIQSNAAFKRDITESDKAPAFSNGHLGQKFTENINGAIFDVYSNSIALDNNPTKLWINLYKNKTEEHYFEQRLNQTAKMKELGIISSSIAHELNNPLGGVLSYLQLVQMDLPKNSQWFSDIKAMIDTTLRMKKIIEDLLIFSRTTNLDDQGTYKVADLLQESLSIHEIHFKNENIKIVNISEHADLSLPLSKTAFRDALHFIFSFYIEKIKGFRKISSQKTGLIEVKITPDQNHNFKEMSYSIEFQGNCGHLDEAEKSKDISLLALSKCLNDQNMHLEIAVPKQNWISLKVIIQKS
ncbi:MAG: hypothetical protein H7235_08875 [Bdellovibrionaceae bacterium]|nr:hypothetical protein [Pseudobdellovibrionaceae bacterium]